MDNDATGQRPTDPTEPRLGRSANTSPFGSYRPRRRRQWDLLAAIAVGGGLGSMARYLVGVALPTTPGRFPWATFGINVTGSFALGLLIVLILDVWPPTRYVRPFSCIGFIGGFTTFSTLAVEMRGLAADGGLVHADAYALYSLIAGLAAAWAGMMLGRMVAGLPVPRAAHRREGHRR
jgi:fluoride exporter